MELTPGTMDFFTKEWFIKAPWGKIAMVSYGNLDGYPVLMVHGRQDSIATFIPLLKKLPNNYNYVGVDLPGHGKSDPFPTGVMLMRMHFVAALEFAVKHLQWTEYFYIAHSLGCELALYYNAIYPGEMKKIVLIDPGPLLQAILTIKDNKYFQSYHAHYFDHYDTMSSKRVYTEKKIIQSVRAARGLTEDQARLVLSRNLTKIGPDQYLLSWERRLRFMAPYNIPPNYYKLLFPMIPTPILTFIAKDALGDNKEKIATMMDFLDSLDRSPFFTYKMVDGPHDVHLTHPERLAGDIFEFLDKAHGGSKAKL